jgi:hypothetical protein
VATILWSLSMATCNYRMVSSTALSTVIEVSQ